MAANDFAAQNGTEKLSTNALATVNGVNVAADVIEVQRVKVGHGVDGDFKDATAANPLPVTVGNFPATQPVSGSVSVSNMVAQGLTDAQLRLTAVPVSGTFFQATQPVSAASLPLPTGASTETSLAGVRTDLGTDGATPPAVLGTGTGVRGWLRSIYEKLTNTLAVTGTFWQATQPVSLATNTPTIAAGSAIIGAIKITDGTNSVGVTSGSIAGNESTVDRVKANASLRLLDTAQTAGSQLVAAKGDQTTGLWVNIKNTSVAVTGAFFQATQPVSLAATVSVEGTRSNAGSAVVAGSLHLTVGGSDGTNLRPMSVDTTGRLNTNTVLAAETTKVIGTVQQAAITKGAQGATGVTTQNLKDAGRVNIAMTCYQAAGIVTTEALFAAATFSISRDGATATTGQQLVVTAGKRFRLQSIVVSIKNTAAAAGTSKLVLRYLAAGGAITNTSPILAIMDLGSNSVTAAAYIGPTEMAFPDGVELIAGSAFGFTSLCNAVTMLHTITVSGYEY